VSGARGAASLDCRDVDLDVQLRRLAYRVAFGALRVFWRVAHPELSGVKCVLRDGRGHVLLVRHSYGPRAWDLPGGIVQHGEAPATTAQREMAEELGLDDDRWSSLGTIHGRLFNRHDTIHVFGLHLDAEAPALTLQPAELLGAMWCDPQSPPQPLAFYTERLLAQIER
jgi:8-oxo-dGTP pyrophosphatase MutT (NUDIX family)